jgi:hypothetical protein
MSIASLYGGVDIAKLMMGNRAFQIPLNIIAQRMSADPKDGTVVGVFQTSNGLPLVHNSDLTHVLMLGDVIVRPHVMVGCNAFQGRGMNSLLMSGFADMDTWITDGTILVPPHEGDLAAMAQDRQRRSRKEG